MNEKPGIGSRASGSEVRAGQTHGPGAPPPRRGIRLPWCPAPGSQISVFLVFAAVALGGLTSCIGGPRNFENDNDRLRKENLQLQHQVKQSRAKLQRRAGEIKTLRARLDRGRGKVMPGVRPPTLSKIRIARYSGPLDTDGDGADDMVRVYLQTLDQKGRMLLVAGKARVRVVDLGSENDQPPRVLAQHTYGPKKFDDAYHYTFTGVHYTLELPLPHPLPKTQGPVTVQVRFTQAGSGATFTAQAPFTLHGETSSPGAASAKGKKAPAAHAKAK